jgi:hypothetical protein
MTRRRKHRSMQNRRKAIGVLGPPTPVPLPARKTVLAGGFAHHCAFRRIG